MWADPSDAQVDRANSTEGREASHLTGAARFLQKEGKSAQEATVVPSLHLFSLKFTTRFLRTWLWASLFVKPLCPVGLDINMPQRLDFKIKIMFLMKLLAFQFIVLSDCKQYYEHYF